LETEMLGEYPYFFSVHMMQCTYSRDAIPPSYATPIMIEHGSGVPRCMVGEHTTNRQRVDSHCFRGAARVSSPWSPTFTFTASLSTCSTRDSKPVTQLVRAKMKKTSSRLLTKPHNIDHVSSDESESRQPIGRRR
jgi:hypothetical protein